MPLLKRMPLLLALTPRNEAYQYASWIEKSSHDR